MKKKKEKIEPDLPDISPEISIDFMSHQGDFRLSVKGCDMLDCKGTFIELLGKVKKSINPKKKETKANSYR